MGRGRVLIFRECTFTVTRSKHERRKTYNFFIKLYLALVLKDILYSVLFSCQPAPNSTSLKLTLLQFLDEKHINIIVIKSIAYNMNPCTIACTCSYMYFDPATKSNFFQMLGQLLFFYFDIIKTFVQLDMFHHLENVFTDVKNCSRVQGHDLYLHS